jgi:hypothetical protein
VHTGFSLGDLMERGDLEDPGPDWRNEEVRLMAWIHKENAMK